MEGVCFICDEVLSSGAVVTVKQGLETLRDACIKRDDGRIKFLNDVSSVDIHVKCRATYINKALIERHKRRKLAEEAASVSPRKRRTSSFDFNSRCLFCDEEINEALDTKLPKHRRRETYNVSSIDFKDTVLAKADERDDKWGRAVKHRIIFEFDLVAASAKYHKICYTNFCRINSTHVSRGRPFDPSVDAAMEQIFTYLENHDDSQFTLKELEDIPEIAPDRKTIMKRLMSRYGGNIVITSKPDSMVIICFRDTRADILTQKWYESREESDIDERIRVVEAAADIIRGDIRSTILDNKYYPPPSQMFAEVNESIPRSLQTFIAQLMKKRRNDDNVTDEQKCSAMCHAIMTAVRPRMFKSKILIGLSVFLHRRFGSKRLIDVLSALGFAASYNEVVIYEVSSVFHPQPQISADGPGALVQYVADNADINVSTLDGHNTVHIMGMIKIITPKSAIAADVPILRRPTRVPAEDTSGIGLTGIQPKNNYSQVILCK